MPAFVGSVYEMVRWNKRSAIQLNFATAFTEDCDIMDPYQIKIGDSEGVAGRITGNVKEEKRRQIDAPDNLASLSIY